MHLMLLFVSLARAAVPTFCGQGLSEVHLPLSSGPAIHPDHFRERALRPGLMQVQSDLCRCLPRRARNRPAEVTAHLHAEPNAGRMRVEYLVERPWSARVERMMNCMGQPTLSFAPIPYVSDMVLPDGRKEVFPHYPVRIELGEHRPRKDRSSRNQ